MTLNPGDIIFIPYGWWHFVTSSTVDPDTNMNIAISNWTKVQKCDCNISFNPDDYKTHCPSYKYQASKLSKLVPIHTKLSMPFIMHSQLHDNFKLDYDTIKKNIPESIPIMHSKTDFFTSMHLSYFHQQECYKQLFTFDDFYNMGMCGEHVYLAQFPLRDTSLNIPSFIDNNHHDKFLWINFGQVTSNLHYDTEDNLLMQVQGTKNITLFPPSERHMLYPYNPYPPRFLCYMLSKLKEEP